MGTKSTEQQAARQLKLLQKQIEEANKRYQDQLHIAADLEREKAFSETLIHHLPAAVSYIDRKYQIKIINRSTLRMLGCPENEEVIGRSLFEICPTLERTLKPTFEAIFTTGGTQAIENYKVKHGDGFTYWDLTQIPMEENGKVEGILTLGNEVTDRIRREQLQQLQVQQLRDADRMKDEFLSIISHEIRTPLNFIMGFASLLEDGAAGNLSSLQAEYVSKILKGTEQLTSLVENLLTMSRMVAGKLECNLAPLSVGELLTSVVANFEQQALEKECIIELGLPRKLPEIHGDPNHLYRVFANLLDNALKFSPSKSKIRIQARQEHPFVTIEFIDHGIGIEQEQLSNIFNSFYQVDMSLTRQTGGIGMGLAIAKGMIEAHGGHISIDSAPGRGSNFRISLPISESC